MGGQHQGTIKQSAQAPVEPAKTAQQPAAQLEPDIRYHFNSGEVHFHDDKAGLKVAMPIATWYNAWQQLRTGQLDAWQYSDAQHRSHLSIQLAVVSCQLDLKVRLAPLQLGPAFAKLDDFTNKGVPG